MWKVRGKNTHLLFYKVSIKMVRKILHAIVILGSIQSTSQCTYYEVQLSIVHLIIKCELVYKVC